jgi:TetR/AcrR family transcriptional regulator
MRNERSAPQGKSEGRSVAMRSGIGDPSGGRHAPPAVSKSSLTSAGKSSKSSTAKSGRSANVEARTASNARQRILDVATKEFSAKGYDGARVDDIMRHSKVSKNLIYHYFGSKEELFIKVLESAYSGMHEYQMSWPLDVSSPIDGIRKLVQSTFKYWKESPEFIGLLNSENFHKGRHLRKSKLSKAGYSGLLGHISDLLRKGNKSGDFRPNVDPIELYISISALAYHYLSNRYTLSYLMDRKLSSESEMKVRIKHIEDLILGYLRYGAPCSR